MKAERRYLKIILTVELCHILLETFTTYQLTILQHIQFFNK